MSATLTALLVTATAAPLRAQGTGNNGADSSRGVQSAPAPSSPGGSHITINDPVVHFGHELPGQQDVPAGEPRLRSPDTITVSATIGGTGGGPTEGGGTCNPTQVTVQTDVQLPGIQPNMDPPPASAGGQGGVVTVPTWFWAAYIGDPQPSTSSSQDYTTCSAHTDVLGRTWWSASQQTATIRLNSAPTGTVFWDFGDRDVSASCGDSGAPSPGGLGSAHQGTIQHSYCVSSIRANHPTTGYPVYIRANFLAHESLNTGEGDHEVLQMPVFTDNMVRYPVREVQAVLDE